MRRVLSFLLLGLLLCGCSGNDLLDRALSFRSRVLAASQCEFSAEITADYGNLLHIFGMDCTVDADGDLGFRITAPESICGISGKIGDSGGRLTFDETVLHFDPIADGQLSPICAPWIVMKALRSGYLTSAGEEDGLLRLTLDDSYEDGALQVDVWMNRADQPVHSEILYKGKKILSVIVKDFVLL